MLSLIILLVLSGLIILFVRTSECCSPGLYVCFLKEFSRYLCKLMFTSLYRQEYDREEICSRRLLLEYICQFPLNLENIFLFLP